MFEINSHFNKRIYELEKQKKDLLDLLKENNIEPDPTKLSVKEWTYPEYYALYI